MDNPRELQGLKVLVVGINYAPEHTGIAPYTTQACEHLREQGAEVFVLAGVPHYPHWSTPEAYRRRLRVDEVREGVRVRRLRHVVPAQQTALTRGLYELTFGVHVLAQRLPFRPDVVLAVVPSLFGSAAAAAIARRTGARLVVWVQDLMGPATAQSGIAGGGSITRATTWLEGRVLRRADQVLVLNEAFRGYAEGVGCSPDAVAVVRNWSHVQAPTADRAETRRRLGWGEDQLIALHSGNMGLKQGLENVVQAARVAAVDAPHVRFVLMGDGSQRFALQELGRDVPTLQFLPPAADGEFTDVLAAADVLLVNERASAVDMSLPSKLTSYFRAGRPVVAAVPRGGGTASEVMRSGAGCVVEPEDASALLHGTLALLREPELAREASAAAAAHARKFLQPSESLRRLRESLTGSQR
ncbi:MAG: glycosyl transferase [Frankiales bacterium]|nr:glycosyl transferase [Frankiales bacterium]